MNADVQNLHIMTSYNIDKLTHVVVLMSSYRDFATDQNWDYLRVLPGCTTLRFESQEKNRGRVELVVLPGWPQIVCATPITIPVI